MSKTDFQDGRCGCHLVFMIDMILSHFNPEVVLDQMFGKRCRKLIFKMATVVAILDFQSAQSAYFVFTKYPNAPHQVSTQLDHSL